MTLVIPEADDEEHMAVIAEGRADVFPMEDVPDDVKALNTIDWIGCWIELKTERVLSYAAQDAEV